MIATTRPMATQDFLLIAVAVGVIVLSLLPKGDARQTLVFRDPSGIQQRYSLKADDPRLAKLRRELATWSPTVRRVPNISPAVEKWRAEIADYYAIRTEPEAIGRDRVVAVSFSDDRPSVAEIESSEVSIQHAHWVQLGAEARKAIAESQAALNRRSILVDPPPIVLGDLASSGPSPRMFVMAGVIGLCVASGFGWWTYVCPTIRLCPSSPSQLQTPQSDIGQIGGLRMAVPATWVRIHQPARVVFRQMAYAAVVFAGFARAIL